jgi:hypothetical protein
MKDQDLCCGIIIDEKKVAITYNLSKNKQIREYGGTEDM